jgi:hypothetical protein
MRTSSSSLSPESKDGLERWPIGLEAGGFPFPFSGLRSTALFFAGGLPSSLEIHATGARPFGDGLPLEMLITEARRFFV